ncbi:hypothetical protein EK21DRAFT_117778 [Setomelanomma holmii]|uniref:Uncharacterized protein n=1 Tax=Setomelanomma holmii TaxID=210430 RepID=A0A9P4GYT0_9PLEO|nr:hypothetical protein EK21DRAFT_117778 [Setomelanomma holmii]
MVPATTALELLKTKMGKDAVLLDQIPVDKVEMVTGQRKDFESVLPYRILLGTIPSSDGSTDRDAWAYLTSSLQKDPFPEIRVYTFQAHSRVPVQCSLQEAFEQCDLREEFRAMSHRKRCLSMVLKICFLMKGVVFAHDIEFTENFIAELCRACRKYMEEVDTPSDRDEDPKPEDHDRDRRSSRSLRPKMMRKSEQRGPADQAFDPLPLAYVPAANSLQQKASSPSTSSAQRRPFPYSPTASAEREELYQSRHSSSNSQRSVPVPSDPAAMRHLEEYLDLLGREDDLEGELNELKMEMSMVNEGYGQRRVSLKDYIDEQLSHVHSVEQRQVFEEITAMYDKAKAFEAEATQRMKSKQLAEVQDLKVQYTQVKLEQEQRYQELLEREGQKLEIKKSLRSELERRRSSFTMDQLLDFIHKKERASKKVKLGDAGEPKDG